MISIILPAYNATGFISDSINSVLNQPNPDWELVIVDDGSTDNTLEIAKDFEQRDSRIKVFTQENSGPSAARKKGVENSTGEWITFLDADDLLLPYAVETFYEIIKKDNCQIYIFSIPGWIYINQTVTPKEFIKATLYQEYNTAPWSKLFSRELFNNFVFDIKSEIRSGEDRLMLLRLAFNLSEYVKFTAQQIYNYRGNINPHSLMKSFKFPQNYEEIYLNALIDSFPINSIKFYYSDITYLLAKNLYHKWRKKWRLTEEDKKCITHINFRKYSDLCDITIPLNFKLNLWLKNPMLRFSFDMFERCKGIIKPYVTHQKSKYYTKE